MNVDIVTANEINCINYSEKIVIIVIWAEDFTRVLNPPTVRMFTPKSVTFH